MKLRILLCVILLGGCATQAPPSTQNATDKVFLPPPAASSPAALARAQQLERLSDQLGLARSPQRLGYVQKAFDGCKWGVKSDDGKCGQRYFSVVHFRLLCRDSVETVQSAPLNLRPLAEGNLRWRLAGEHGEIHTDRNGFGQVQLISQKPSKGKRFILMIGSKSLGLDVREVSKIVLPGNWCSGYALNSQPRLTWI